MTIFSLVLIAATAALVLGLALVHGALNLGAWQNLSVSHLGTYGTDLHQTSVFGVSSGGAMAVQIQVAHSSIMRGVGVIAGVVYECTDSALPFVGERLACGVNDSLPGAVNAAFSIGRTTVAAGAPGAIEAEDGTATSVELVLQPNNAASGYNIYRAPTPTGPFTKINSQLVTGAVFVDGQLQANSTNQYQIEAVDQNGIESQPTGPIIGVTAADPPTCDPYYSDNVTHVMKLRAFADVFDNTWGHRQH
jgi:hypothetical protein